MSFCKRINFLSSSIIKGVAVYGCFIFHAFPRVKTLILKISLIVMLLANHSFASEQTLSQAEKYQTAVLLNTAHAALYTITSYKDAVVLEEQYNEILNNLDLSAIRDPEIISLLTSLLDTLSQYRINEEFKALLKRDFENKIDNAIRQSIRNGVNANAGPIIFEPVSLAVALTTTAATGYRSYTRYKTSIAIRHDIKSLTLKKSVVENLTKIRGEFLNTYWQLMQNHGIPDSWRITEKQFKYLQNNVYVAGETVANEERYRNLDGVIDDYYAYPKAHYYLAQLADKAEETTIAIAHFKKFIKLDVGIFREDNVKALSFMHLAALSNSPKEKLKYIQQMLKETPLDGRRNLFAALIYIDNKMYAQATQLFQKNRDNKMLLLLSSIYQGNIAIIEKDNDTYDKYLAYLLDNNFASGRDILHLISHHPELRNFDQSIREVGGVDIELDDSMFSGLLVNVKVPFKWISDVEPVNAVHIEFENNLIESKEISTDEDAKITEFIFPQIFEHQAIEEQPKVVTIHLSKDNRPLSLTYKITSNKVQEKGFFSKGLDSISSLEINKEINQKIADLSEEISTETAYQVELMNVNVTNLCIAKHSETWQLCNNTLAANRR